MRKLYVLLACLAATVYSLPASSTPDIANFNFTINAATNHVAFTNTSVIGSEPGTRRALWVFGDGSSQWTGGLDGTQHVYQSPGTYTACLRIFRISANNTDSVLSSETCKTFTITSVCHANFEVADLSSSPLGRHFVALPSHSQNKKPVQVCWNFGDGQDTCIQYTNSYTGTYGVFHQYAQPGAYNVCVKIVYEGGCEAQHCRVVQTGTLASCGANFEWTATNTNPLGRTFFAQLSHSQNKKPVSICWQFGDNSDTCIQYSSSQTGPYSVYHQYAQPGNYNVCVKITYEGGCDAHACKTLQIGQPDSCAANWERTPSTSANNPLLATFKALPWHQQEKKPVLICWRFGDNQDTCIQYSNTFTGPYIVNHSYANPGNYEVCVKIVYQGGCEAQKCRLAEIRADSCKANFERINLATTANSLYTSFRALPWHSNNKKPSRICWTFGDGRDTCVNYGADYNGQYTVQHQYQQPGQYNVCVKIIYYGGCEASLCRPLSVPQNRCSVKVFAFAASPGNLTRSLYALAQSVPHRPIEKICWNFGDGTDTCIISSATNPVPVSIQHSYPAPGVYRACVRIVFQGGCVAEGCTELSIGSNTHLCGGYMTDSLVAPRTIKFKAFAIHQPNDPVVSYKWTFGDGAQGGGPEVIHTYANGAEFRVCLTILTQSGCETKICKTVRLAGTNQAVLQLSPNPVVNVLHAFFLSTHSETVTIKITNASGVVVRTFTRPANAGANNWDFDLAGLLPGTYLFTVQSPSQLASAVFVKQ